MRSILLLFGVLLTIQLSAQSPTLRPTDLALQKLAQDPGLAHGSMSFIAVNLDNGKLIADQNGQKSMVPASLQKLVTTAAALETLGANFQYSTVISASADESTGIIQGDLYVAASGDPTLQSKYYQSSPNSLQRIQEVLKKYPEFKGNVVIDASEFSQYNTPRGWIWEDMGNYFGATPSALIWEDNMLEVYLNSGQAGTPAMLSSKTEKSSLYELDINVMASESNKDDAWFFGAPGSTKIYAKGTIPVHKTNFLVKAAHPNSNMAFGDDISAMWADSKSNVRIDYDFIPHTGLTPLLMLTSPPLSSIIRLTNQQSLNLYAEALTMKMDKAEKGKSIEGGVQAVEAFLKSKRLEAKGIRIADGSGLSPTNRFTCQTMVDMLGVMYLSPNKDTYLNSLSVAGQSGTLANSFTSLSGKIKGKSGTMSGVRNYAGYLTNNQGETIAFCLMMNDYDENRKADLMRNFEALLSVIAED
jgi:serine-type D-Ala-D-Ala carboxypeptidase/endopeptidase (penicillin-binding protein 4)